MAAMAIFALIHSPLTSPFVWQPVARGLRARGHSALVPDLADTPGGGPYWQQHAESAARHLRAAAGAAGPVALVAHSGAGALLPAIRTALGRPVAAYVFVDAGLPHPGRSRLESFGGPDEVAAFRAYLEVGGRFPAWTAADLAEIVPDAVARARLVRELRPRGLDFWTEPLPAAPGWPDAPGAVLRWTATYAPDAERARALGWRVWERAAGHFEMLVQPEVVADELVALAGAGAD
jgi:hypothetical protein